MNTPYLPAFAALAGSAIGGLTSFASARLTQYHQDGGKRYREKDQTTKAVQAIHR
jgi:hypothetical protein